ncbi:MAG TPA: shikimate kinase [Pyrinomonadaceae bacterium]|jgi:shikimate kinase|nr:shikimate kinase [Pyrinomonadaceae bacterium]
MSEGERILITGFMAAGKTTVAAALTQRLDCRMLDLDQFIVEREGRSIAKIIDEDGEARFREIEERALFEALENDAARIIALGGGTWMSESNRAAIARHNALTVWLDAPFELCWKRITSGEQTRPLARDEEITQRLYQERRAIYSLAAIHIRVNAADDSDKIMTEILSALQRRTTKGRPNRLS